MTTETFSLGRFAAEALVEMDAQLTGAQRRAVEEFLANGSAILAVHEGFQGFLGGGPKESLLAALRAIPEEVVAMAPVDAKAVEPHSRSAFEEYIGDSLRLVLISGS